MRGWGNPTSRLPTRRSGYKESTLFPAPRILAAVVLLTGAFFLAVLPRGMAAAGRVLQVGPTRALKTPAAAAAVARDGDTVAIDAGAYPGDVAVWNASHLTLRGAGGEALLPANGKNAGGKAIWVLRGDDTTVEHIDFSGCTVPDHNGAGIRQEGKGLTVRYCRFHDNEDGILTGANPESDIRIEYSEFAHNGAGDGYSHNMYIGHVRKFTLQFCISRGAKVGHLVKSRAAENDIRYNRLMDEQDGTSSYVIDLPNGGKSVILGNILQHGPKAENGAAISYAKEGAVNPVQALYVVNNTYINARGRGNLLNVGGDPVLHVTNNLIVGTRAIVEGNGILLGNRFADAKCFVDAEKCDFHLLPGATVPGAGVDPGTLDGAPLTPEWQYVEPLGREARPHGATLDAGAYQRTQR